MRRDSIEDGWRVIWGWKGLKRAPAWVLGYLSSQGGVRTYNINE